MLSPGVIETEVLSGVLDEETLANYKENKIKMGGGIGPEHVSNIMLHSYQMPQNALIQEICITTHQAEILRRRCRHHDRFSAPPFQRS